MEHGWFRLLLDVLQEGRPSAALWARFLEAPGELSRRELSRMQDYLAADAAAADQARLLRALLRQPRPRDG